MITTRLSFLTATLLAFSFFGITLAGTPHNLRDLTYGKAMKGHHSRASASQWKRRNLQRRFSNARFTFYDAGQNACGSYDHNSDFIVALNSAQFDNGAHCYQEITINYGGKTTQAKITDECPGCPYGGLDFSRGLFDFFALEDIGVLYGSWDFDNAPASPTSSPNPPSPSPPPPPPPPTPSWSPTSTYIPPAPSTSSWSPASTYAPASTFRSYLSLSSYSTSSTFSSFTITTTSSTILSSSTALATTATPAPTASGPPLPEYDDGYLNQFNMALVGISGLMEALAWA